MIIYLSDLAHVGEILRSYGGEFEDDSLSG
jgi:hypothetical protein